MDGDIIKNERIRDEHLDLPINESKASTLLIVLTHALTYNEQNIEGAEAELERLPDQRKTKLTDAELEDEIGISESLIEDITELIPDIQEILKEFDKRGNPNNIITPSWSLRKNSDVK